LKKIRLSSAAESDLSEIWFYIAQDNVESADRFVDRVYEKCLLLAESP
jgi:toxin ParE1/3/4